VYNRGAAETGRDNPPGRADTAAASGNRNKQRKPFGRDRFRKDKAPVIEMQGASGQESDAQIRLD